MVSLKLYEV